MKKITFLFLLFAFSIAAKAQKINRDTLAKYSQKDQQLKVFNTIGHDIHLTINQTGPFNQLSMEYANQALAIIANETSGRSEKLKALRKIGSGYVSKLKTILSPEQIDQLKDERSKYHFGRRFLKED